MNHFLVICGLLVVVLSTPQLATTGAAQQGESSVRPIDSVSQGDATAAALAQSFANLVRQAIGDQYERKVDWDKTKEVTLGWQADVEGRRLKLHRRKKNVNHGVWKHYRVKLIEPDKQLLVRIDKLRSLKGGHVGFTLYLAARLESWARARIYQYGAHLITLTVEGDGRVELALDCELGLRFQTDQQHPGLALVPRVVRANLTLQELNIRRLSHAKGPLVQKLGQELGEQIVQHLDGPRLVTKLNRAIDKKRDQLQVSLGTDIQQVVASTAQPTSGR